LAAGEIENLHKEAQALKRIRQSMGSDDFAKVVFEKVFTEDIDRLRSMEDMWKSRKPPQALNYEKLSENAKDILSLVSSKDQTTWSIEENFKVFKDSLQRLSSTLRKAQSSISNGNAPAILTFDKDDKDTLDFVAAAANLRSIIFGIEPKSEFDIKQMAGNIIPAIATTNAIVAGLCVLQAFRVMKDDFTSARMIFLTKSADRIISADKLQPPKPECQVCGVAQSRIHVDTTRATLKDLVEDFLRLELGYGEEFSVNNEVGTLYDPDLDDNLDKKFSDLGIKGDSFLTIVDEDEDEPRVNLVLSIAEKYVQVH
jgi:ubiquitin-like 1-activating enzyme E1 B